MNVATTPSALGGERTSMFSRIGAFLVAYGDAHSRHDRIVALNALTDEELSRQGLTRDGIVGHVFADRFYL